MHPPIALAALVLSGVAVPPPAPAVAARDRVIAAADLVSDLAILRESFETLHPGLYRSLTKADADALFVRAAETWSRDRTLAEAFLDLTRWTAAIRCGHTFPNMHNQSKAVRAAFCEGRDRVPFAFRWIDRRMVITHDCSEAKLPRGTEVLAINGIAAATLLDELMPLTRADGSADAKRVAQLEVGGVDRYEAFDIDLPLIHPEVAERLTLRVREPGASAPRELAVTPMRAEDRNAALAAVHATTLPTDKNAPQWELTMLDDGTGYLAMHSWALYNSTWDWKASLHATFDKLAHENVPALIIDLRDNEGGLDVGNEIASRLADREIRIADFGRFARCRTVPQRLNPYLDTWDDSFRDWGKDVVEDRDGFYRFVEGDDSTNVIAPRAPRYHGKVIVLIGPTNSSATFQFARLVTAHALATTVGQPTGGNQRGINGGAFFFLRLPKSGLEVDLPLIARFPNEGRPNGERLPFASVPDGGVAPMVMVTTTIEDIAAGRDPELAAARALCKPAVAPTSGSAKALQPALGAS